MSDILTEIRRRSKSLEDIFSSTYQPEPTNFVEDPLVLSCVVKRLINEDAGQYFSLENAVVKDSITDSDRDLAENIRRYYTKKWFWQNLKDSRGLSDFRTRTCYLLENRIRQCKEKDAGIYYKLPWFYDEDMIYDEFKKNYKTTYSDFSDVRPLSRSTKVRFDLTYLKSTVSRQQKRKLERFWFTDGEVLYNVEILQDNPLIEMFRYMIEPGKSVSLEGYCTPDRVDQLHFFKLFKFNFIKE